MCLYPRLIKNPKYIANKKNRGVIPPVNDIRVLHVPVGCGKCMECKKKKAREWQVRLQEDLRVNKNAYFVTYTFSNEALHKLESEIDKSILGYDRDNEVCRLAIRRYTERWRKKYKHTLRHWLVTEIGSKNTERVHIHGIVWTDHYRDIEKIWKYGKTYIGEYVNDKTINYIVKYVNKIDKNHKQYNSKIFTSKGIGKNYINRKDSKLNTYNENGETKETYTTRTGTKLALPIYYRNKIYNEEEREKLWLEKLDKGIRWVNGIKIDVSKDDKAYFKILNNERKRNKRLGYGDNQINWEQKKYETQLRNQKKIERTKDLEKKYKKIIYVEPTTEHKEERIPTMNNKNNIW
jgi:hypothetical protein